MEGTAAIKTQRLIAGVKGSVPQSTEPLMVLHAPSGTVTSGGHQWWFVPQGHDNVFSVPLVQRWVLGLVGLGFGYMSPGRFAFETNQSFAVRDREALRASARVVLDWRFDALLDLHAQPDSCPASGVRALLEDLLEPIVAGDWERVPWRDGVLSPG